MSRLVGSRSDKRAALLAVAEQVFGEVGLARARLEDIASQAGMRRPSLLHHFSSKSSLYAEVIENAFVDFGVAVTVGVADSAGAPYREVLDGVSGALMNFVAARPAVLALMMRELIDPSETGTALLLGGLAPLLDRLVRLVRDSGGDRVPDDFPVRDAVVALVLRELVHAAANRDVRKALWPDSMTSTTSFTRTLLFDSIAGRTS